jgi:polyisoprenoid-binding protein YceI
MPQYDEKTAECQVFTFKDGLLSKIAHDLDIAVTRFKVDVDPSAPSIRAEFDASSLRVRHAVKDGVPDAKALSDSDKDKIASQIQSDVLEVTKHERILFVSKQVARRPDGTYSIAGDLTLHGTTRSITTETRLVGNKQVAEVVLNQPDYGVVPFKAMLGTLKVKPELRVRLSIPDA